LFFSRENFTFSTYFPLHVHTGLNFQTGMNMIKFNTRNPRKQYTLSSSDVDFETFEVLGTTLT